MTGADGATAMDQRRSVQGLLAWLASNLGGWDAALWAMLAFAAGGALCGVDAAVQVTQLVGQLATLVPQIPSHRKASSRRTR